MIRSGILNPHLASLLCRFRHTNTLVIADRGFPYWPDVETVDLSLVDDIPRVLDVLRAIVSTCQIGRSFMAEEFLTSNPPSVLALYREATGGAGPEFQPHIEFKRRIPSCIGLVRTGDTTQYGNIVLESA